MARKKIVFIIVEGPSDYDALGVIFSRLYNKNEVYVEITHGDITSDLDSQKTNIVIKIANLVKKYAKSNHYKNSDFQEIIHLIDMDGTYVSDDIIHEDLSRDKPFYTLTGIYTSKRIQLIERNRRKADNINRICFESKIWSSIPYTAYYMSSNLDHVLYNKLNSTDDEKEKNSLAFSKKYKEDLDGFLKFIQESDFSVTNDFKKSWEYIKEELHSLERHTNLGICFEKIIK
ncbi:hypothetical protein B5E58_12895 [Tyzzerella sp. An114]|uniref:hypothetical protein n=1 Tax=Tyzzerella sp. An114 TaxID=1965545 RepID=UPI000B444F3D|nr:hypothetical protein [Tyzzerella sp. An114]OUQ55073.1 hypothetical protein B5E58_12895 [Tyzzerella sp. An114]